MTLCVVVKVNAGIAMAADSAISVSDSNNLINNVYNNGNKVFNLCKGLPIGAMFWGNATLGKFNISILAKDFRRLLSDSSSPYKIDINNYTMKDVAEKFKDFIYNQHYAVAHPDLSNQPGLGFFLSGYSSGGSLPELYSLQMGNGSVVTLALSAGEDDAGIYINGQPEAVYRLVLGVGSGLGDVLKNQLGLPDAEAQRYIQVITSNLAQPFVYEGMPLQDAIDLAEFFVELTTKYMRFLPVPPTVGEPIDVASITKHEGFKWIKRKHYYNRELNPEYTTH